MAGLLYYIEGAKNDVKIEALREFGLGHAFDNNGDYTATGVSRGPGESGPGIVVADTNRLGDCLLGLYPDQQKWGAGSHAQVQIGYYTADAPTPDDLARRQQLDGHSVELGDGNHWMIPIARGAGDNDGQPYWFEALPKRMTLNGDRKWVRDDVVPAYAELWKIAQLWADAVFGALIPEIQDGETAMVNLDFDEDVGTAARIALSTNYRVDDYEVALLDLFSDERFTHHILNATIDRPRWEAMIKKKLIRGSASGSTITDGPLAVTPATDQA